MFSGRSPVEGVLQKGIGKSKGEEKVFHTIVDMSLIHC
jgi:hypothetical protein